MLVLTRKLGEQIAIGPNIEVTVCEIHGNRVRLGINAPREVPLRRGRCENLFDSGTTPLSDARAAAHSLEPRESVFHEAEHP
jgi:carbon storage regulator CsrA